MSHGIFSFEGRIRRTEYGLSFLAYGICATILNALISTPSASDGIKIFGLFYIPLVWFLWSQGARRCHDLGKSGWWQIIPFYVFWLIFQNGQFGDNEFGQNPKGNSSSNITQPFQANTTNSSIGDSGYQAGYNGGHNQNVQSGSGGQNNGYVDGDLYK